MLGQLFSLKLVYVVTDPLLMGRLSLLAALRFYCKNNQIHDGGNRHVSVTDSSVRHILLYPLNHLKQMCVLFKTISFKN